MTHLTTAEKRALAEEIRAIVLTALTPLVKRSEAGDVCPACYGRAEAAGLIEVFAQCGAIAALLTEDPDATMGSFMNLVKAACELAMTNERAAKAAGKYDEVLTPDPKPTTVH